MANFAGFYCGLSIPATACDACFEAGLPCNDIAAAIDGNAHTFWDPFAPNGSAFSIEFTYHSCLEAKQLYVLTAPGDRANDRSEWTISVGFQAMS